MTTITREPSPGSISFEVSDVTGTHTMMAEGVQSTLPAEAVANSLAASMNLPSNVPWAIRDDESSAFLEDGLAIGDQIRTGAAVTLTPKTHLG